MLKKNNNRLGDNDPKLDEHVDSSSLVGLLSLAVEWFLLAVLRNNSTLILNDIKAYTARNVYRSIFTAGV